MGRSRLIRAPSPSGRGACPGSASRRTPRQVLRLDEAGDLLQRRVYGFNGHKNSDTSVKGQAQGVFKTPGGTALAFHMDVTCVSVWGNEAWIGSVVRSTNDPVIPVGRSYLWRVVDNGQGQAADDDRLSFYVYYFGDAVPIDQECALHPTEAQGGVYAANLELGHGNLTIH